MMLLIELQFYKKEFLFYQSYNNKSVPIIIPYFFQKNIAAWLLMRKI